MKRLLSMMSVLVLLAAIVPASVGAHDSDRSTKFRKMQQRIDRLHSRMGAVENELGELNAAYTVLSGNLRLERSINQNQTRSIVALWAAVDELRGEHSNEPDHPPCGPCPTPDEEDPGGSHSASCGC